MPGSLSKPENIKNNMVACSVGDLASKGSENMLFSSSGIKSEILDRVDVFPGAQLTETKEQTRH